MKLTKDTPLSELLHSEDELTHYGIPGMKWGVRRYQNEDGSLTPKGRKRYHDTDLDGRRFLDKEGYITLLGRRNDSNTIEDTPVFDSSFKAAVNRGKSYIEGMPLFDGSIMDLEPVPSSMPLFNLSDYADWD